MSFCYSKAKVEEWERWTSELKVKSRVHDIKPIFFLRKKQRGWPWPYFTDVKLEWQIEDRRIKDENRHHDEFVKYSNTRVPTIAQINSMAIAETGVTPEVVRLNGKYNINEGPGKSLQVMPGDVVEVKVFVKYLDMRQDEGIGAAALLSFLSMGTGSLTQAAVDGAFSSQMAIQDLPLFWVVLSQMKTLRRHG